MEYLVARYLARFVHPDIDVLRVGGKRDRGDVAAVRIHGQRVAVEVKNVIKPALPAWTKEAEIERINYQALAGVVVHKRHGKGRAEDQWVSMTLGELVALINGNRDHIGKETSNGDEEEG